MPSFHGKKYWREVAPYMEPIIFWPFTWQPKPPIVNIHGIHTLQLPGDVEKARKLTFLLSLIILVSGLSFIVTAILEFSFSTLTGLNFLIGCIMIGTYFYTMLEVVLKQDYVIQYEELSQNGLLDLTHTHLRKMSSASKGCMLVKKAKISALQPRLFFSQSSKSNFPKFHFKISGINGIP